MCIRDSSADQIDNLLGPRNLSESVPLIERWWTWFSNILFHWNWGLSPTGESINEQVAYRVWISAELVLGATIITTILGIALGVYTASRQYKLADRIGQGTSIITMNIPTVVAGFALVLLAINFNNAVGTTVFYVVGSSSQGVEGFFPVLVLSLIHI